MNVKLVVLTGLRSKHFRDVVNSVLAHTFARPVAPEPTTARAPKRQRRLTAEQRSAVVRAYIEGQSMATLATDYSVKRDTISKLLRNNGVHIRRVKQMSEAQVDEATRLYDSGQSLVTIGERLGWDHKTIYRQLKKHGVVMRGPNDWQQPTM